MEGTRSVLGVGKLAGLIWKGVVVILAMVGASAVFLNSTGAAFSPNSSTSEAVVLHNTGADDGSVIRWDPDEAPTGGSSVPVGKVWPWEKDRPLESHKPSAEPIRERLGIEGVWSYNGQEVHFDPDGVYSATTGAGTWIPEPGMDGMIAITQQGRRKKQFQWSIQGDRLTLIDQFDNERIILYRR